jgi:hypothetical protein
MWYIRFPDGRVLRADGAAVVRQQLKAGRLPVGTRLRRSPDDKWQAVERYPEFADLAPRTVAILPRNGTARPGPATIASRLDPVLLRLAGVRGLVEDLLAALDSTMGRSKLGVTALAGLLLGGLAAVAALPGFDFAISPPGLGWVLLLGALVVWSLLSTMLSRMTYVELSRLRPARWRDGLSRWLESALHLAVAQGLLLVVLGGLIVDLRSLPGWLLDAGSDETMQGYRIAAEVVTVVGMVLEVVLWPLLLLLLPLGALVVVEQYTFPKALREWARLVWQKPGRLVLAEGLALGVGLVIAAPLGLLVSVLATRLAGAEFALAATLTQRVLLGLLGSVVLGYLVVANVFIYLNLRYER